MRRSGRDRTHQKSRLAQNAELEDILTGAAPKKVLSRAKSYILDNAQQNPMAPESNKRRQSAMKPKQVNLDSGLHISSLTDILDQCWNARVHESSESIW